MNRYNMIKITVYEEVLTVNLWHIFDFFFFIYRTVSQLYLLHWVLFYTPFVNLIIYGQFLN